MSEMDPDAKIQCGRNQAAFRRQGKSRDREPGVVVTHGCGNDELHKNKESADDSQFTCSIRELARLGPFNPRARKASGNCEQNADKDLGEDAVGDAENLAEGHVESGDVRGVEQHALPAD